MPSTPDRIVHRGHKAGPPFSAGRERDVAVRPINYYDIPQAVRTADKALAKESATQYVVSADKGLLSGLRVWLVRFIRFAGYTYRRRGFVIEDGVGVVVYATAHDNEQPWLVRTLWSAIMKLGSREAAERHSELGKKTAAMVQDAFGDGVHDMYEIRGLVVSPEAQGRGYGKALVKTVTDMSDASGKDLWLLTSNARSFYETNGFECIRTCTSGEDNPTWTHDPIELCIMLRRRK